MKVKNINGRRQNSCKCGTWLDHWARISGRPLPEHCAETKCMGKPELGAHVQKDSLDDSNWYIIPLCVKHSLKAEFLEVADTTAFVSAHVNETCAKQLPLGYFWPHEWRVTLAHNALKRGADPGQVQDWLDHAISKTRTYGKRKDKPAPRPPLKGMY